MPRILALMKYGRRAASTRQRLLQYEPYLNAHGFEVHTSPLLGDDHVARLEQGRRPSGVATARGYLHRLRVLLGSSRYDLIWVHYELFPYLPGLFERLVRLSGRPLVYDVDDAVFHMYDDPRRPAMRRLLGGKLAPLLRRASACLCGNAYLRDYAARYCPNSLIVPTVVDTDKYLPRGEGQVRAALTVGWIGSPTTWRYVESVLPVLLPVLAKHKATFRAVGAGPAARGIAGVEAVDWTEEREIADVQAMDIGIMPLPDEPWARGKCGYKLIQYMACGLPVVASPVGVNSDIVRDRRDGLLVRSGEEWAEAIQRLLSDAELRLRLGESGRARIVEHYSLASQQPVVLAALRSALGEPRRGR